MSSVFQTNSLIEGNLEVMEHTAVVNAGADNYNEHTVEEDDFLKEVDFEQQPKSFNVDLFQNLINEIEAEAESNRARFAMFTNLLRESHNRISVFEEQLITIEQEAEKSRKYFRYLSDKVDSCSEALNKRISDVQGIVTSMSLRVDELCKSAQIKSSKSVESQAQVLEHEAGVEAPMVKDGAVGIMPREQILTSAIGFSTVAGDASAVTICTSGQHLKSSRRGISAGVPKDAGNLAGEAPHRESVEQQESVVMLLRTKVRKRSSSATAEGTGAQHISSTIIRQEEVSSQRESTSGVKRKDKSQTALAQEAGSRYCSLETFRGECDNCRGPHHRHVCTRQCVRCKRDIPSRCSCHHWMQKRRREQAGRVPSEQSLLVKTQVYEDSHSCSKKKAYLALLEFVRRHSYIMLLQRSEEFTLEVQGELRSLLLSMRREDRCVLYRRAQRYYKGFGLRGEQLTGMLSEFCSSHPEVLSGKEYGVSLCWDDEVQLSFFHLIRAGACFGSEAQRKQQLLLQFYESFRRIRAAQVKCQKAELKSKSGGQASPKVQVAVRGRQGPPAEPLTVFAGKGVPLYADVVRSGASETVKQCPKAHDSLGMSLSVCKDMIADEAIAARPTISLSGVATRSISQKDDVAASVVYCTRSGVGSSKFLGNQSGEVGGPSEGGDGCLLPNVERLIAASGSVVSGLQSMEEPARTVPESATVGLHVNQSFRVVSSESTSTVPGELSVSSAVQQGSTVVQPSCALLAGSGVGVKPVESVSVSSMAKEESSPNSQVVSAVVSGSILTLQPVLLPTRVGLSSSISVPSLTASVSTSSLGVSKSAVKSDKFPQARIQNQVKLLEDIPTFEASGSNSNESLYSKLAKFVSRHPYILKDLHSPEFTLSVQYDLRIALRLMMKDDTSVLFRVSRAYLDSHRMPDAEVLCKLERFCSLHPEVINTPAYDHSMSWTSSQVRELCALVSGVYTEDLRLRDMYVKARKFSHTTLNCRF